MTSAEIIAEAFDSHKYWMFFSSTDPTGAELIGAVMKKYRHARDKAQLVVCLTGPISGILLAEKSVLSITELHRILKRFGLNYPKKVLETQDIFILTSKATEPEMWEWLKQVSGIGKQVLS